MPYSSRSKTLSCLCWIYVAIPTSILSLQPLASNLRCVLPQLPSSSNEVNATEGSKITINKGDSRTSNLMMNPQEFAMICHYMGGGNPWGFTITVESPEISPRTSRIVQVPNAVSLWWYFSRIQSTVNMKNIYIASHSYIFVCTNSWFILIP